MRQRPSNEIDPARWRLIENLVQIERRRDNVRRIDGSSIVLRFGTTIAADVVFLGTGYEIDLSYLQPAGLN